MDDGWMDGWMCELELADDNVMSGTPIPMNYHDTRERDRR